MSLQRRGGASQTSSVRILRRSSFVPVPAVGVRTGPAADSAGTSARSSRQTKNPADRHDGVLQALAQHYQDSPRHASKVFAAISTELRVSAIPRLKEPTRVASIIRMRSNSAWLVFMLRRRWPALVLSGSRAIFVRTVAHVCQRLPGPFPRRLVHCVRHPCRIALNCEKRVILW